MEAKSKFEILVECSGCGQTTKKSFNWLRQKHLPCSRCGAELNVYDHDIAQVEREMVKAIQDIDSFKGTNIINLKI